MDILVTVFLLFIVALISIVYLLYWLPKRFGYPKSGKVLSITAGSILVSVALLLCFDDYLFFKDDARKLLAEQDVKLINDFKIVKNESMNGIGDYYHTFTLAISKKDKELIIKSVENSLDFRDVNDNKEDLLKSVNRYTGDKQIQNYEDETQFVREYFEPNGKGYAPTYRKIEISKKGNKLIFEDIDE